MTQPIESIDKETALAIHSAAVARFGGLDGVRDKGLLESALAQPFQTFGGEELYPTVAQKAARYAYGIASNHPFADGNKRTAFAALDVFLRLNGLRLEFLNGEMHRLIMRWIACPAAERLPLMVQDVRPLAENRKGLRSPRRQEAFPG